MNYVELTQGFPFEIPFIKMMQQVLDNHGLHSYVENEFIAAIYQAPRVRLMVHKADEWHARELMHAFFGRGFLIRMGDLYSD
ncbi:MAG TPA: DUF2007 domain-containing protein [Acidobacteriota bacterium]|jgi:hypothetical protein